jgi:hypothetical protein
MKMDVSEQKSQPKQKIKKINNSVIYCVQRFPTVELCGDLKICDLHTDSYE